MEKSIAERKQEILAQRTKAREELQKQEDAQEIVDLEALVELENEHGIGGVKAIRLSPYTPGQPTRAYFVRPQPGEYKRYRHTVGRAAPAKQTKDVLDAQDQLGRSVLVYPKTKDERDSMHEAFPGVIVTIAIAAAKFAEAEEEEEGKG